MTENDHFITCPECPTGTAPWRHGCPTPLYDTSWDHESDLVPNANEARQVVISLTPRRGVWPIIRHQIPCVVICTVLHFALERFA